VDQVPGSLEDKIQRYGNVADMLRNVPVGAYTYPMKPEFSNWRDEQAAWKNTAVLFDQSFHMTDVCFRGPDVLRLLSDLGVNTFKNFGKNKAKQFVACNYDGYVIGDAILFGLDEEEFSLVGRPITPDWVAFHAETGDYDVKVVRDERSVANQGLRLTRAIASSLFDGLRRAKYLDMPSPNYATGPYDKVLIGDRFVGFSANAGYTVNVGGWCSLGMVDEADAVDGTEVTLVWGEENGGSAKPGVERHVQTKLRATLSTRPLV
jgi:glycine cleavage system aminomethyltransferase T